MQALQGKVAVITGGSSGIGLATAKRFVAEGAFVFITGRRQAELDKAAKEIGKNVVAVRCDVSKLEDLDRLYEEVAAKKGKIDIIFANVGMVRACRNTRGNSRALRQDVRYKRSWRVFHGAESITAGQ
jgi:NAD(P)-dependent dehydrogenase (short-subunit alcohol dehydrogenase family)